jgi:hypothetical protein
VCCIPKCVIKACTALKNLVSCVSVNPSPIEANEHFFCDGSLIEPFKLLAKRKTFNVDNDVEAVLAVAILVLFLHLFL